MTWYLDVTCTGTLLDLMLCSDDSIPVPGVDVARHTWL